jgi:UDP-glucose 4-epimerase
MNVCGDPSLTSILVTGASGFVGRAVCERALSLGMKVKGSHRSPRSKSLVPAGVENVEVPSVGHDTDWSRALTGVTAVMHLAARVHIAKEALRDPLPAYRGVNTAPGDAAVGENGCYCRSSAIGLCEHDQGQW